VTYQ